jgi:WD40 repeat protein
MRLSLFQSQNVRLLCILLLFSLQSKQEQDYIHIARLQGSQGPINSLAFTKDGKYLASGGRFL